MVQTSLVLKRLSNVHYYINNIHIVNGDGSDDQFLKTDGSGNLSFAVNAIRFIYTYGLTVVQMIHSQQVKL